ncbi:MAG: toll/interleukin-1 receptor domain-containing protein [Deltaproteobacteria bacterium]|nr:toll/interleukin-1 receptor domain-containing protein [Deltaproteobacteria bacterium]
MLRLEEKLLKQRSPLDGSPFVLFSFDHQDRAHVLPIISAVKSSGYDIWFDKAHLLTSSWSPALRKAVSLCRVLVVFISDDLAGSRYGRHLLEFSKAENITVLPVYLDGPDVLPPNLKKALSFGPGIFEVADPEMIYKSILHFLKELDMPRPGPVASRETPLTPRAVKKYPLSLKQVLAGLGLLSLLGILILFGTFDAPTAPKAKPSLPTISAPPDAAADAGADVADRTIEAVFLSLPKAEFHPGEKIVLTIAEPEKNVRGQLLAIAAKDAAENDFLSAAELSNENLALTAPDQPGEYELRLFEVSANDKWLSSAIAFTVSTGSVGSFPLEVSKFQLKSGEGFEVKISELPQRLVDQGAIVGIFPENAEHMSYKLYIRISSPEEAFVLHAPYHPGRYEVRVLSSASPSNKAETAASIPIEVLP